MQAPLVGRKTGILTGRIKGLTSLATFEPFPKNPPISKVFREIGLADELGSGMRNSYKYTRMYSNSEPQFVEGDVFRVTIPLLETATATVGAGVGLSGGGNANGEVNDSETVNDNVNDSVNDSVKLSVADTKVLAEIRRNPQATRSAIASALGVSVPTLDRSIRKLKDAGYIARVGSDKAGHWKVLR